MAQQQTVLTSDLPVSHRRIVEEFYRYMFEEHDAASGARLYTEDATLIEPPALTPIKGRKAIQEELEGWLRAFPDMNARIENVFGSGDWFAVELRVRGTNTGPLPVGPDSTLPATNKRAEMAVCWLGRVSADGLLAEDHTYFDAASMLEQLGIS